MRQGLAEAKARIQQQAVAADARGLADTVVAHIVSQAEHGRVSRWTIAVTVLSTLQRFDRAAATYYAAFHGLDA